MLFLDSVVLLGAYMRSFARHGFAGYKVRHAIAVRITSFREQAKKLIAVSGKLLQDCDAAGTSLRGVRLKDRPRIRGRYQLPHLQILKCSRDQLFALLPEDTGLPGHGEVALVAP